MLYAVKLLHPGRERKLPFGSNFTEGEMPWSVNEDCHRRKFLSCFGRYICCLEEKDKDGQIMFWGEWEPPSHYKRLIQPITSRDELPRYSHIPRIERVSCDANVINTDPYVLGESFYYSCCQQKRLLSNRVLPENSIILFGSRLHKKFVLDTVFVIEQEVKITSLTPTAQQAIMAGYSDWPTQRRLFKGKMWSEKQREMFSFFPCIQASELKGFKRPAISFCDEELNSFGIQWSDKQGQGFACAHLKKETVTELWKVVVNKVFSSGLFLGVYAAEPTLSEQD